MGVVSTYFENEDTALICNFTLFFNVGVRMSHYFYKEVPASKNVGQDKFIEASSMPELGNASTCSVFMIADRCSVFSRII